MEQTNKEAANSIPVKEDEPDARLFHNHLQLMGSEPATRCYDSKLREIFQSEQELGLNPVFSPTSGLHPHSLEVLKHAERIFRFFGIQPVDIDSFGNNLTIDSKSFQGTDRCRERPKK